MAFILSPCPLPTAGKRSGIWSAVPAILVHEEPFAHAAEGLQGGAAGNFIEFVGEEIGGTGYHAIDAAVVEVLGARSQGAACIEGVVYAAIRPAFQLVEHGKPDGLDIIALQKMPGAE